MKRFVFSLLALAALAAVPSCMKEPVSSPDPALGGSPVEVSFQVNLDNMMTKADNTDLDNASGSWNLYVAAFSTADGSLISTSKIGGTGYEPVETLSGSTQKTISLTLSKGASYKVVFFAEKAGAYDVSFADKNVAKFSYKSGLLANSAGLDAFFATVDVSSSTTVYSVTLKRPFAQVNVLVPLTAVPTGQTAFSSAMKVKAPTTFDLFAGAATGDVSLVEFANSTIAAAPWGKYATTHKWVGMNYVLVSSDGMVEVTSFKESGMPVAITPGKVPAKMNGRTNLVGNIYDLSTDFNFTVQIGIGFDSEKEEPVIADETVITIADNSTYTAQNPLTIDASAAATPQNVTLRVNGHTFTEVLAGAAQGATITATSANTAVAKAAVSGNDVVITPVGNGQTVITVTTPAYTKADYRGASFEIPVKVEGMTNQGGQGEQPEPPAGVQAVTVAQFLAASPSETQKYQMTGKITGTVNATYGNFDLEDATGKVYVYGLTKTDLGYGSTNDMSFASLGLKAGDTVTLIGYRYTFTKEGQEDKIEVMYAYYVSHESGSSEGSGGEQGGGQQGGGDQVDPNAAHLTLTNAEILAAVHDASVTGQYATYGDVTITSTSGTWTGNVARHPTAVNYIQLRNQQAAQLTSPVFSSNIDKVVFTMTDDDGVSSLSDRTLHAVPANTTLPTAKDEKYSATVWANQYGSVKTGTTKGAQVTMSFTGDTKQFMLVVEGGATFIKDITVYFK